MVAHEQVGMGSKLDECLRPRDMRQQYGRSRMEQGEHADEEPIAVIADDGTALAFRMAEPCRIMRDVAKELRKCDPVSGRGAGDRQLAGDITREQSRKRREAYPLALRNRFLNIISPTKRMPIPTYEITPVQRLHSSQLPNNAVAVATTPFTKQKSAHTIVTLRQ